MRNSSIELLRVIAMFSIIIGHVFFHGFNNELHIADLLRPYTNCGVNIFILISGYYGIHFKKSTLIDLLLMVSFYTVISLLINYFLLGNRLILSDLSGVILPYCANHYYWFITCYITLYVFAPLLNKGIESLKCSGMLKYYPPLLIYINCFCGAFVGNALINNNGFNIMHFIFLYVLARTIKLYGIEKLLEFKVLLTSYILLFIITSALGFFVFPQIFNRNSLLMVALSLLLLCIFLRLNIASTKLNKIAKTMFPVYLLQEGIAGKNYYSIIYSQYQSGEWMNIIIYVFTLFIMAYIIEYFRKKMTEPIYRYLFSKFNLNTYFHK